MNNKKNFSFYWLLTVLALGGLFFVTAGTAYLFHKNRALSNEYKSNFLARNISENLRTTIETRVAMLTALGEAQINSSVESHFNDFARSIAYRFDDIYAINFINSEGVIEKTFPRDKNHRAHGRNIFDHPEGSKYLALSQRTKQPQMSHRITTFQGVQAYTLYVPLLDDNQQLIGWLNAVVDLDTWLNEFLQREHITHTRLKVHWFASEVEGVDIGPRNVETIHNFQFDILNQRILIEAGFLPTDLEVINRQLYTLLVVLGGFLVCLVAFLVFRLGTSRKSLIEINSRLTMSNALLSSLTHDIANPLLSLQMSLENLEKEMKDLSPSKKERVLGSLKALNDMLKNARKLHAQGLRLEEIRTEAVLIKNAFEKALEVVEVRAAEKQIRIIPEFKMDKVLVLAEPSTLINNVFPNVLSNAIKFSPPSSEIRLFTEIKGGNLLLTCENQGAGFTEGQLRQFESLGGLKSKRGTQGEKGTGIGLIQIKVLMEAYGGSLKIENSKLGARLTLIFKKV